MLQISSEWCGPWFQECRLQLKVEILTKWLNTTVRCIIPDVEYMMLQGGRIKCSGCFKIFLVIRETERISWNVSFVVGGLLFLPLFLHYNLIYCQLLLISFLINTVLIGVTWYKILKRMQNGRVLYLLDYVCKQYRIQTKLRSQLLTASAVL